MATANRPTTATMTFAQAKTDHQPPRTIIHLLRTSGTSMVTLRITNTNMVMTKATNRTKHQAKCKAPSSLTTTKVIQSDQRNANSQSTTASDHDHCTKQPQGTKVLPDRD